MVDKPKPHPISSAPQDGTHVLLYTPMGIFEGWYVSDTEYGVDIWEGIGVCADGYDEEIFPTHWMPLNSIPENPNLGKK